MDKAMDQRQWELLQQMLAARQGAPGQPGMPGTPGGPVQESPTMKRMRALQGGLSTIGGLGISLAGIPLANLPMTVGGPALTAFGGVNANEPNIRDVWLDQLRMKMQGN